MVKQETVQLQKDRQRNAILSVRDIKKAALGRSGFLAKSYRAERLADL